MPAGDPNDLHSYVCDKLECQEKQNKYGQKGTKWTDLAKDRMADAEFIRLRKAYLQSTQLTKENRGFKKHVHPSESFTVFSNKVSFFRSVCLECHIHKHMP
jgi:hypothetical protein